MVNLSQDLKPISYVKAHITEVVDYVGDSRSPVIITQNGEAKAVLMDIESYEKTIHAINLSKLLQLSEKSAAGGKLTPHEKVKEKIEETLRRIKNEEN
ncbi:MAG: type II toxin-antitoxin system Phd/YefM family antitoxin [Spirochaetaceae bacterium]|jgi:prevent-host-death family protein|nr:type II toxin-antitoxin system Phd/YefM family antitoxin [Spirochaetaceae bacterium]